MKKRYVVPLMESEEFVANEYVATCSEETHYNGWKIECNTFLHKNETVVIEKKPTATPLDGDGFYYDENTWYFSSVTAGKNISEHHDSITAGVHKVTVNPNAS